MSKTNLLSFFSVAALTLGLTIPAGATTVTVAPGPFSPSASVSTTTFDSGSLPGNFVSFGPDAGVVSGSVTNVYRAPAGDATPYAYVGANSFIAMSFAASPISSFGLYWGSIDSYNGIAFTDVNGVVSTYGYSPFGSGTDISTILPSGLVDTATSAYVTFETSGAAWASVAIFSAAGAFEFDNVAVTTPEPASIALLAGGLLAIGAGALRRRRSLR